LTPQPFNTGEAPRLTPPRIYLLRMAVFLILVGFVVFILQRQIQTAFLANPALNGLIGGVLFIGIILAVRQVGRLFREVRWVNGLRREDGDVSLNAAPVLLAPVAALLGERAGHASISTVTLRSMLDSVGMRLDESRDISRYLTGLLVFLGLLGTFWGLLETVSSVSRVIQAMGGTGDTANLFEELKSGLAAPLAGMGISFSSSLFGLSGSLVLGFLDLQAGQAQNRFFNEFEEWLSARAGDIGSFGETSLTPEIKMAIEKLTAAVGEDGGSRACASATAHLAEGIQGLVQHMRSEQQMIRDWVEAQAEQQRQMKKVLERLSDEMSRRSEVERS